MSSQHKRPLLAFVAVALLCGFVLGNAARGQAMGALAQVVPQVVVVTRIDKIAPLVAAGGAAVAEAADDAAPVPADEVLLPVAAKAAPTRSAEEVVAREGRRDPLAGPAAAGRAGEASDVEDRPQARGDAREQRDEAREERRAERDRAREDRRDARDRAREDRREAREDRREARDEARDERRELRDDRRERRDQAREDRRERRDEAREDRRERRDQAREDRRERRDHDRRDRGRSHRR